MKENIYQIRETKALGGNELATVYIMQMHPVLCPVDLYHGAPAHLLGLWTVLQLPCLIFPFRKQVFHEVRLTVALELEAFSAHLLHVTSS